MSPKKDPFESGSSLREAQNTWATQLLENQAALLKILASENLLDTESKKNSPLENYSFSEFNTTQWNKYRKVHRISFTRAIDLSVHLLKPENKKEAMKLIQKIHALRLNLINSFIPLIQFIARKYAHHNYSLFSDLNGEGYVGLLKCLDSFYYLDPLSSIKNYSIFYIKQEMRRFLLENQKGYRIPYIASIRQKKEPEDNKIRISHVQYFAEISENESYTSSPYENNIPSSIKTPPDGNWDSTLKEILEQVLGTLPENERLVLILRYGLNGSHKEKKLSLRQIGEALSLSKESIRQIEKKALKKLHHFSKKILTKDDLVEEN